MKGNIFTGVTCVQTIHGYAGHSYKHSITLLIIQQSSSSQNKKYHSNGCQNIPNPFGLTALLHRMEVAIVI